MARRGRENWNARLAQDLRVQESRASSCWRPWTRACRFIAPGKVIRAMGVKELAAKVNMAGPNVLRAFNPRYNPTQDPMNRLLKPFQLKLSLARIE